MGKYKRNRSLAWRPFVGGNRPIAAAFRNRDLVSTCIALGFTKDASNEARQPIVWALSKTTSGDRGTNNGKIETCIKAVVS